MSAANPNCVAWIPDTPQPLCPVPWAGTSVVLADGNVNFCCCSSAVVGNVNQQSFEEIWNGPIMRDIRRALIAQVFPPECRSQSCPIYRGDEFTFIDSEFDPYGFHNTGTHDPHALIRERLCGTGLRYNGDASECLLEVRYQGEPLRADIFAAVQDSAGVFRFLPSFDEFAVPMESEVMLQEDHSPLRFQLQLPTCSARRISVALFVSGSNPNLLSNCYWSETENFDSDPAQ
jgi:hypothetical protein